MQGRVFYVCLSKNGLFKNILPLFFQKNNENAKNWLNGQISGLKFWEVLYLRYLQ